MKSQLKLRSCFLYISIILFACSAIYSQTESKPKMDLHTAVIMNNVKAVKQHIKIGKDLNIIEPSYKSTPLISAAAFGKIEIAKLLIDEGVDLNIANKDGSTALHTAAFFCHKELVEYLLEHGADKTLKNKDGKTAYEIASVSFEKIKPAYDAVGEALKPLGITFDYDEFKVVRPQIAELLN